MALSSFLSQLLPIATLLAALLMFAEMQRSRELVSLWNSGISPIRLMRGLLPVGCLLAAMQFTLDDQILPETTVQLREWQVGEFSEATDLAGSDGQVWLRSGSDYLRISQESLGDENLKDLTLFRRDDRGLLYERLDAESAQRTSNGWLLREVTRQGEAQTAPETLPVYLWDGSIEPEGLQLLARPPRELSLAQLAELISHDSYGQRSPQVYQTWIHARVTQSLTPILLLLLAVAWGQDYRRSGTLTRLMVGGVAIGFSFFVLNGTSVALSEVGAMPSWMGAWAPFTAMTCLIAYLVVRREASEPIQLRSTQETTADAT
ncbi:LptF/LptG family permease [Fodinicurvata halophila]|uniref:LptF/LptG family permease n=1 Tax=Fodinicurvata halophila TaxID=1419723 RepID=UPI0036447A6A